MHLATAITVHRHIQRHRVERGYSSLRQHAVARGRSAAPGHLATGPVSVLDTDARTLLLSSFNGLDPHGGWTLFVADISSGEEHTLNSWSLQLTGVPEPASCGGLAMGGLLVCLRRRRD